MTSFGTLAHKTASTGVDVAEASHMAAGLPRVVTSPLFSTKGVWAAWNSRRRCEAACGDPQAISGSFVAVRC